MRPDLALLRCRFSSTPFGGLAINSKVNRIGTSTPRRRSVQNIVSHIPRAIPPETPLEGTHLGGEVETQPTGALDLVLDEQRNLVGQADLDS